MKHLTIESENMRIFDWNKTRLLTNTKHMIITDWLDCFEFTYVSAHTTRTTNLRFRWVLITSLLNCFVLKLGGETCIPILNIILIKHGWYLFINMIFILWNYHYLWIITYYHISVQHCHWLRSITKITCIATWIITTPWIVAFDFG